MPNRIQLDQSWLDLLQGEFDKNYFAELKDFLAQEKVSGKIIYPPEKDIFAALQACQLDDIKVVIIGQDPNHGQGQANGLCFSVRKGIKLPPSLSNIYKELETDLSLQPAPHGDLSRWAKQGVLLLNATLTVEATKAGSHQNKGWEPFTNAIIEGISRSNDHLVFMLWGGYAKRKGKKINRNKHLILESGHPSPLSANRGYWFGNRHFSKCNAYLIKNGKQPIHWSVD